MLALVTLASAVATGSASAKAKKLDLVYFLEFKGHPFENQVPIPSTVEEIQVTGLSFESRIGNLTCPDTLSGFIGTIETNNQPKDQLLTSSESELLGDLCTSTIGLGDKAIIRLTPGAESSLYLGANHKAELKAPQPASPHTLTVKFSGGTTCSYIAAKLKASEILEPIIFTFTKQKLKLLKPASVSCPKNMSFNATYPEFKVATVGKVAYGHLD